jgi:hypothetical protein
MITSEINEIIKNDLNYYLYFNLNPFENSIIVRGVNIYYTVEDTEDIMNYSKIKNASIYELAQITIGYKYGICIPRQDNDFIKLLDESKYYITILIDFNNIIIKIEDQILRRNKKINKIKNRINNLE